MLSRPPRKWLAALALALLPLIGSAAGVSVRFDLSSPNSSPFPSDRFTVFDFRQNTFRHVNLPKPDCVARPSDCADIDVINTLDGFNVQPRITVPFTGPIDVTTVNSNTVYLLNLGDTLTLHGFGQRVGINQIQWDPTLNTLIFESDELLNQHSRYALIITDGVKDASGDAIEAGQFGHLHSHPNFGRGAEREAEAYSKALIDTIPATGLRHPRIVGLSIFTTQSTTADLEKIRNQLKAAHPAPADFMVGTAATGPVRAVFPTTSITAIDFKRQTGTAPVFSTTPVFTVLLNVVPGAVGQVAFGKCFSPSYETDASYIPAVGTLFGTPKPQGSNELQFTLFVPAGPKPAGGWPVAIFGHGFTDSKQGAPWAGASVFASKGIATIAINVVGHGGGALGELIVHTTTGEVSVPAGGRGIDQDGNGSIDSTEGSSAAPPRAIIASRDGLRQTVIDLMQLVRVIQRGVDIDGDGEPDLDAKRIYYSGQSFGGIYGTIFLGVETDVQVGVPNVAGGAIVEVARLGGFRPLVGISLATRVPSLINVVDPSGIAFNENIPLRDLPTLPLPPVVNNVTGAVPIQVVLDNTAWVSQSGNPVAYAPYIRKSPLPGAKPKSIIFQFAKGDETVPNPTATAVIRAGDFADRATFYRNDLAFAVNPAVPKNPHTFLTNVGVPAGAAFAVGAQTQIATFFASGGTIVIDPDGAGPIFEVPVVLPLPETLNFIP